MNSLHRRWLLWVWFIGLAAISVTIMRSIAPTLADNQAIFFLLGAGILWLGGQIPWETWQSTRHLQYAGLCALLIITLLSGRLTRGSTRWIEVGPVNVQASQLAMPIVGLWLAHWVSQKPLKGWKEVLTSLAAVGIPGALIFIAPDLGTTLVYVVSLGIIIYLANRNDKILGAMAGLALMGGVIIWLFFTADYQRARMTAFLEGHQDRQGSGYNAQQALIAVGSGRIWGRGLGLGLQSHLRFLPERHTDFVFASLAEELGLVGSLGLLFWYISLIAFIIITADQSPNQTAQYYGYALATFFILQSAINIGMNIGLLPITGITLPFVSYGGSSILSLSYSLALYQSALRIQRPRTQLHLV
jgi:cell division protein FtsW (lipid II flippase)